MQLALCKLEFLKQNVLLHTKFVLRIFFSGCNSDISELPSKIFSEQFVFNTLDGIY